MKVVVATSNQHKVDELRVLFEKHGVSAELITLKSLDISVDVEETGATFEENAYIKASAIFNLTGLPTLADDSGLEVDVLDGRPGVYSARFSGEGASDESNRDQLRLELDNKDVTSSVARFRCVLCYIDEYRTIFGEGSCEGTVQKEDAGNQGFGYDPQFVPLGHTKTFAQLGSEVKQELSHRATATKDLTTRLRAIIANEPPVEGVIDLDTLVVSASIAAAQDEQDVVKELTRTVLTDADVQLVLYETLLQSYLFGGFPTALDALTTLAKVLEENSLTTPTATELHDVEAFKERGRALCKEVYGSVYDKMMERLGAITPDLSSWMIIEGYGKTLSRPGMTTVQREIGIVAQLACLERRQQLVSHVRGAFNVGASRDQLELVYEIVSDRSTPSAASLLRETIDRFTDSDS